MDIGEIKTQVRSFVTTNFYVANPAALADDASLLDQGIIDSTGILELVFFLEGQYGIAVSDKEMIPANLDSIARVAGFVGRKIAGNV